MKTIICYFLAAISALLLSGPKETSPPPRVVTGITVSTDTQPEQVLRHYTSPDKMRKMLGYIRSLKPFNIADLSEVSTERGYRIRVQLSDGSELLCRQRENRLFQRSGDIWREIDPERAIRLELILYAIPGD